MKNIENDIKNSLKDYEIKTTSEDILIKFNKTNHKKSFNILKNKRFILSASIAFGLLLILLIPTLLYVNNSKGNTTKFQGKSLTDSSVLSTVSFQLLYSGDLEASKSEELSLSKRFSSSEFSVVSSRYTKLHPFISDLFNNKNGISSIYSENSFQYNNENYYYTLLVDEYTMYLKDDIVNVDKLKTSILIKLNDEYYTGYLDIRLKDDEYEIEYSYSDNEYTYVIERNYEKDEYSMEYKTFKDSVEISSLEIELEYDDEELICTYEYESEASEYQYEITKMNEYKYYIEYEEDNYKALFYLDTKDHNYEYTLIEEKN